jgi:hypothetical protein
MEAPSLIGWREWVSLPELGIRRIKTKVDTGARTSALHAFCVEVIEEASQKKKVCFVMRLHSRRSPSETIQCSADLVDIREITDSGGHKEQRCVIKTPLVVGRRRWIIEITLTSRDNMRFKMLLGRTALTGRFIVDPSRSYLIK